MINNEFYGYSFAKFVKAVLKSFCDKSHLPIVFPEDFGNGSYSEIKGHKDWFSFDVVLPNGLPELGCSGETLVDIKGSLSSFLHSLRSNFARRILDSSSQHRLVIINSSNESINKIASSFPNCRLIGKDFFIRNANVAITDYYFYLISSPNINRSNLIFKKNQAEYCKLKEGFLEYQGKIKKSLEQTVGGTPITLLLGNGVSMSVGSRSWSDLGKEINALVNQYLGTPQKTRQKFGTNNYSDSLLSHYCCKHRNKSSLYFSAIYNCVYKDAHLPASNDSLLFGTAKFIDKHNPRIVSFNYDDLLERELKSISQKKVESVWEPSSSFELNQTIKIEKEEQ
jgi:hypothetical protein